jgi:hypothetical protein
MFSERMQVLLTPEQRARLERLAARQGRSIGALVRDAVDAYTAPRAQPPAQAAEALFALQAPVDEWERMKAEIARGALGGIETPAPGDEQPA